MTPLELLRYHCACVFAQCDYDRLANRGNDGWQLQLLRVGDAGDCDSFAYTLGVRLIQEGFPAETLTFWTYEEWNGWHAVLQVKLPDGSLWIVDPTHGTVRPREGTLKAGQDMTWEQVEAKRKEINQGKKNG